MADRLVIRNGQVLTSDGMVSADVTIADGMVTAIGQAEPEGPIDGLTIDAQGAWVGPGFVDLHVHFREPGQEYKEDIASGSRAAAAGGYTAVVAMPNTDPAIDSGHLARFVMERGQAAGLCEVIPAGCVSASRAGLKLAHLDDLWESGVRIYSDDGDTVADAGLLRRAMEYLAERGGVIAQHAVDGGLAGIGTMHEGVVSSRLGMAGIPAEAEEVIIARDLALVRMTGARYHVQHLTTATAVALIAEAKSAGLPVTAEVTPHHLMFNHEVVEGTDPVYKMMPPLRTSEDVDVLRDALRSGVIDAVATDHAPHAAHEKDVPFEEAPNGVTGLEWAAAAVNTTVSLGPEDFFDRMSNAGASIAGITERHGGVVAVGRTANIVVFDPAAEIVPERSVSQSDNSPYLGESLLGKIVATIYNGAVSYQNDGGLTP